MKNGQGLYHPSWEHDACGIGFVAHIKGLKTHSMISDALSILENMAHRGACGCEENTGDGAGIMLQTPHEFLFDEFLERGIQLPAAGRYGVAMIFFPKEQHQATQCREILERAARKLKLRIAGYRAVPVNREGIGQTALGAEPVMEQAIVLCPDDITDNEAFERKLFVLRNYATHIVRSTFQNQENSFYIASLSSRTLIYKGQLTSSQVRGYFPDLSDERMVSAFGLVHSRFATNTFPSWALAQPFRYIAHNGEINTLQGNLNWLKTNERHFSSRYFSKEEMDMLLPLVSNQQSDSACLDNIIEMLALSGRALPHVLMMLIPEAWDGNKDMDPVLKSFYEFHACLMEPWDGPAAVCFTNGKMIGATLDRNGLRPARYTLTSDDRIILASETGVLDIAPGAIKEQGRLQPGKMLVVDMEHGVLLRDKDIKESVSSGSPYGEWLEQYKIRLSELPEPRVMFTPLHHDQVLQYQKAFGYTREAIDNIISPMCLDGKEPVGSMGTDIPPAILSEQPQHLSSYFKQLFAQVTNPPIDPIRERMVMSLSGFAGNTGNLLEEQPQSAHCVALNHPVLHNYYLEKIRSIDTGAFQSKTLQCYFRADGAEGSLKAGLDRLCRYAEDAVKDGYRMLILQDRAIDSRHAAIPSLLATAAVHHHLIRKGMRGQVGIIAEAGDVWEVHHFACLIAFGATAINPYMAFASIRDKIERGLFAGTPDFNMLRKNYIKAVNEGLLKVFSKMGISTLQSYHGAQIFEILGLNNATVDKYFTGAICRIGGLGLDEIAREALAKHTSAFGIAAARQPLLPVGGTMQWNHNGEFHLFNPSSIHLLQQATRKNDYSIFKKYSKVINEQDEKACTLRSLLKFIKKRPSISIDEVEPAANIYKRFATGAMSFGSVSWEAHTTLAIAMNRLGGKSNTGEGGEDEKRYEPLPGGDSLRSSIKQVASARFGVTSRYLTEADELQIKMAQGAKPGEGGQLPGHKVDEWIGRTRHATPGVGLISPPPHHDIYSIEDLAQLIFDLKNANRDARISVKLVSKAGVGTIAAGVAKAKAEVILVSGFDGGTGASPLSSIQHAGLPWELGLAEAHQTLILNKLRSRVVLQTDGQLRTGKDIAIAALLGAEEWGIATAALVAEGCILMRKCHLNTCPVGIATQDATLRERFTGNAEYVINFFRFITEELREIMAELGFRTIEEMVGQTAQLTMKSNLTHWKHSKIDLQALLFQSPGNEHTVFHSEPQEHNLHKILDQQLVAVAQPALEQKEQVTGTFAICNTDRTAGTMLANEITRRYKSEGLPENTIRYSFKGTAGQSFGAFTVRGMHLEVCGAANDFFGKGLSGARLVIKPDPLLSCIPEQNIIIGNVAFYGATSGEGYIRGQAGERFAVRNSGAHLVVEGLGDHGCEYMTGGTVVILGATGRNFAAGMSGGTAYVFDAGNTFDACCNTEMVELESCNVEDQRLLREMIRKHQQYTGSAVAAFILNDWQHQCNFFRKVMPVEYKRALQQGVSMQQQH